MRTPLIIGILLFLGFAVVNAPAGLLRPWLAGASGVQLLQPAGTLWQGRGELYLGGISAGRVDWELRPAALLRGALGYHVRLEGVEQHLTGDVRVGFDAVELELDGNATGAFVNRWLATYDIAITGDLRFDRAALRMAYRPTGDAGGTPPGLAAGTAAGHTEWSGGAVRYSLAGRSLRGELPPLVAYLGEGLEAVVYPRDGQTPLLTAEVLDNGFLRLGMTRLLTNLLNNPWPGSTPDHDVVLELEERLF